MRPLAKKKYKFDPEQLTYTEVRNNGIWYVRAAILLTAVFAGFLFLTGTFDGPQQSFLEVKRNKVLGDFSVLHLKLDSLNAWLREVQAKDEKIYRPVLEVDSLPASIRLAGVGGSEIVDKTPGFNTTPRVARLIYETEILYNKLIVQNESFSELSETVERKNKFLANIPALQPVSVENFERISSYFGSRTDPFTHRRKTHHGIDYTGDIGDEIYAAGGGVVIKTKHSGTGYGNEVVIDHGFGYKTRYAHLHDILVHKGDTVKRGACIATMGNTGRSTGPHLHYEVMVNGKCQNPMLYYPRNMYSEEYDQIVKK